MRMTKLILIDDVGSLNSALLLRLRQSEATSVISILVCLGIYRVHNIDSPVPGSILTEGYYQFSVNMEGTKCNVGGYTAVHNGYYVVKWEWVYGGGDEREREALGSVTYRQINTV